MAKKKAHPPQPPREATAPPLAESLEALNHIGAMRTEAVAQQARELVDHTEDVDQHTRELARKTEEVHRRSREVASTTGEIADQTHLAEAVEQLKKGVTKRAERLEEQAEAGAPGAAIADETTGLKRELAEHARTLATETRHVAQRSRRVAERSGELAERAQRVDESTQKLAAMTQELARRTQELTHARALNDMILNSAGEGILSLDREGRIVFVNPVGLAGLGYTLDELVGRPAAPLLGLPTPGEAGGASPVFEAARDSVAHPAMADGWLRCRNGARLEVEFVTSPLLRDGEIIGAVILYKDVTERKRLEAELKAQLDELAELSRLKSELLDSVSHELRAPITSIQGYAEFLEDNLGGRLSPEQSAFVQEIKRGVDRLKQHVDDLLDFSRLEGGTFALSPAPTDLDALVEGAVHTFEPAAKEAGLTLAVDLAPERPKVPLDARRIEQVVFNLVGNAIKFSKPGGTVRVRLRLEPGRVVCEVEDSGIGIAEGDLPKLFQRFGQLEAGRRIGLGTGLGLNISKKIVEAHSGTIGARSTLGVGSTFWFALPLKPAPARPA